MVQIKHLVAAAAVGALVSAAPGGWKYGKSHTSLPVHVEAAFETELAKDSCDYTLGKLTKYEGQVVAGLKHHLEYAVSSESCDTTMCKAAVWEKAWMRDAEGNVWTEVINLRCK